MPITALFGGTFNPFHIGHYEILKALNADEEIGKILLLPDSFLPIKAVTVSSTYNTLLSLPIDLKFSIFADCKII